MVRVELQILIRRNGRPFLGSAAVALLQEIERCGSLRVAARGMHCSYQHAWDVINDINQVASQPVVIKQRGGAGGGGATLSSYGKRILGEYKTIERVAQGFARKLNA